MPFEALKGAKCHFKKLNFHQNIPGEIFPLIAPKHREKYTPFPLAPESTPPDFLKADLSLMTSPTLPLPQKTPLTVLKLPTFPLKLDIVIYI